MWGSVCVNANQTGVGLIHTRALLREDPSSALGKLEACRTHIWRSGPRPFHGAAAPRHDFFFPLTLPRFLFFFFFFSPCKTFHPPCGFVFAHHYFTGGGECAALISICLHTWPLCVFCEMRTSTVHFNLERWRASPLLEMAIVTCTRQFVAVC